MYGASRNVVELWIVGVLDGFVNHVDDIVFLEEMPNIQEISFPIRDIDCLVFLVSNHRIFRIDPEFDVAYIYLVIPIAIVVWVNHSLDNFQSRVVQR